MFENKKMRTIVLIAGRSGSKRIPDKNIRELGGLPLMVWSIASGLALDLPVYVSTDSWDYARIAKQAGAIPLIRPEDLARDDSGDYGVIRNALVHVRADLIVYLRPTTPFRTITLLKEAIRLMSVPGYDSLRSVEEMSESAYKCFRIKAKLLHPLNIIDLTDMSNQSLPRTYHPNGYIDIVRREIVESGSLWGSGRFAFITPRAIEIDTPDDWDYAEYRARR